MCVYFLLDRKERKKIAFLRSARFLDLCLVKRPGLVVVIREKKGERDKKNNNAIESKK